MTKRFFILLSLVIVACGPAWAQQIPKVQHVFVVLEENTNYADVCGPKNVSMPFLCSLKVQGSFSANYYAPTHPSIGNYEDMGWGVVSTNDDTCAPNTCGFAFSGDNIVREVLAAGKTWKGYAENLPSACYFGGDSGQYAVHHSPIPYISDAQNNCSNRFVAFEDPNLGFAHDLANNTLPSYAFITPNTCDDGHDCTLPASPIPDRWLQNNVLQPLISSGHLNQATGDTVVIVTFDESGADNTHGGGAVYWFMMGQAVKQNYQSTGPAVSPNYYSHESSLRLTAELLGLNFSGLGGAATAPSMTEFFPPGVPPNPPTDFKAQVLGVTPPNPTTGFSATVTPTPPTIWITAPATGAIVLGTISVTAIVSSNTTSVQLAVDGKNAGVAVTGPLFNFFLDTTTLSNGSHLLTAVASNAAAQSTTSNEDVIIANNPLAIATTIFPMGQVSLAYTTTLLATGGTTPYRWSISAGSLPSGLTLSSAGVLSGTPIATGLVSFTAKVTDAAAQIAIAPLQMSIAPAPLQITTTSPLASGQVSVAYSTTLTATGGSTPYTWSVGGGSLPSGLTLSSAGVLSGTPTASGPVSFTAKVTDATAQTATAPLQMTIDVAISVSPKRGGVTVGQPLLITATVANDVGAAGVSWTVSGGGTLSSGQSSTTVWFSSASAGVYTITATSIVDNTISASATIGVTDLAGVFTYHNNLSRDGSNPSEYVLTTSNVTAATFGKLFSCAVDGAIYTQPLWVANLAINNANHNVVFVATQHEGLYAFDADASPCVTLWHASLIDTNHGGTVGETSVPSGFPGNLVGSGFGDITPEVGVTGTPVIDPSTNTLYVVSKSVIPSGPTFFQRLHAIDILTGNEWAGSPVAIAGTFPGTGDGGSTTTFIAQQQNQRPGLALINGVVYIAWASHEDHVPFYGWVMGYNAASLAQTAVLNVTPNVGSGGIWMGGSAPAADTSNNLYLITSNATFDANSLTPPNNDYGDSFLKVTSNLSVSQYFTPSNEMIDNASDQDFGSGGAAILVDQPTNPVTHLVIGGGKDGYLYLLNRDAMGGLGDSNAWQRFYSGSPIFATGAFWNGRYYLAGVGGPLQSYSFNTVTGKFDLSSVPQSPGSFGFPGSTPSVSSSGTVNGIVWALDNGNYCTPGSTSCGPTVLHAYDATNIATELWNSTQGTGNAAGNAVKFTAPTVANGKVYVGTRGNNTGGDTSSSSIPGELDIYGLLPN